MGEPPRPRHVLAGCLPVAVALLLVAGLLTAIQLERPATAAPSCDRVAVMNARLDELGRAGYRWQFGFIPDGAWGAAGYPGSKDITISDTAPCDAIVTVVNHEWMHARQEALFPGRAMRAYGEAFEIVADCGSMLLGSPITPYLERRKKATGQEGCTADELDSARYALGWPR
ncbi:hypothetical protein ACFORH_42890 [Amycolatopsis roodepoortensis]|uniref:Lipoprotein n=1 Tax=Amycolatopsis roodepoortensis TaxID=700274 RepID=A0ABR9L4J7_9PSEU|nr:MULTISPECIES: hypothetical protein [Amycolatopsis]MBE1575081.1 hypothetical protein [Amycolatopsis roodepoortensis]